MDISTTCDNCQHSAVCFARRKLKALNQEFQQHTLIYDSIRDFEQASEDFQAVLAAHCHYFKRRKSDWS